MTIQLETKPALVVIDLQSGIIGQRTAHPIEQVVGNAARLAAAFRAHDLPVVLVNVGGTAPGRTERTKAAGMTGGQTVPEGARTLLPQLDQQPSDITLTKRTLGAFLSTDLDRRLRDLGVAQVVLTGVTTTSGVESTARSAYELGYHVAFVIDAMTDGDIDVHDNAVAWQLPKLGELGTTDEVVNALDAS